MKNRIILLIFALQQVGFIYCDDGQSDKIVEIEAKKCCDEAYQDQSSKDQCKKEIVENFIGSYLDNKMKDMKEDIMKAAEIFGVICKRVGRGMVKENPELYSPDIFGFIMAAGFDQYEVKHYEVFAHYLKNNPKNKEAIINQSVNYWQILYDVVTDFPDELLDNDIVLLAPSFKKFINIYYQLAIGSKDDDDDSDDSCRAKDVIKIYIKLLPKILLKPPISSKSDILTEIKRCRTSSPNGYKLTPFDLVSSVTTFAGTIIYFYA